MNAKGRRNKITILVKNWGLRKESNYNVRTESYQTQWLYGDFGYL